MMSMTLWSGSEGTCPAKGESGGAMRIRAGWVESYKTEEKKKKQRLRRTLKGTGLNVVGTSEPLQFFQQVSYEIKMVFQP